ncbi:MAG: [LysW]-lysine hydrolase [Anaerolineaceae bacterium]|nr:[LysW]-lysine hydrolase [Anaerolineaceae bacterium]
MATRITPATLEALLHDLVAIPSPSHDESGAVQHLVSWMAANGFDEAFVDAAGNAVGIRGAGSRDIVLLGHIDTFGGMPPVRVEDRRLYGRGAVDAKGSLCTFAAAVAQAELPLDTRLIVIGAVEEEARSSKGARFAAEQYQPALCIIGEPSAWDRMTLGYKGRLLLRWRWEGALAHSASQVASPPEHAVAFWERVTRYAAEVNAECDSLFNRLDVTLQQINSGQDGAYGWAEALVGFRLPPDIDPHELAAVFTAHAGDAIIEARGHERAYLAPKDTELARAMRRAIREQGGRPTFVLKTGTSDMNVVAPVWNCPILAYGPGDSSLDHTPNEHLDLDEYLRAVAVLTGALSSL